MSLEITLGEEGRYRVISDTMNPRIYSVEWKCKGCGTWFDEEQILWVNPDGSLSTDSGDPYCDSCCPPIPDEGYE